MNRILWLMLLAASAGVLPLAAQQTFSGRLSDSMCAASHQIKASAAGLTDRQCIFECLKAGARYVLVDQNNQVIAIANQDVAGLPLYAGRLVRLTGERQGDAIVVSKVEAIPAHLHIGHLMTNWRDTPGTQGFLPVALGEAKVALTHAKLAAAAGDLDGMKLHAGHVLHALDPAVEPKGPGAGYGVKKAATGALQHLEFAVKSEGASSHVQTHAAPVAASLRDVLQLTDEAIATAQKIRASTDASEAGRLVSDLSASIAKMTDIPLHEAQSHMEMMLKAEGLLGAPR
jgi:hypothetical protein